MEKFGLWSWLHSYSWCGAGVLDPWRAAQRNKYPLDDAPPLCLITPRSAKPKPPKNEAIAELRAAERAAARAQARIAATAAALKKHARRERVLHRRADEAQKQYNRLQRKLATLRERATQQRAESLSEAGYAARMRAKRETQGAAPATR